MIGMTNQMSNQRIWPYGALPTAAEQKHLRSAEDASRPITPWQNLANAIVESAANDYRKAKVSGSHRKAAYLKRFFKSEWFSVLTSVNPSYLVSLLEKDAQRIRSEKERMANA